MAASNPSFDLEHLGIHASISALFPPEELIETLDDLPVTVSLVEDRDDVDCEAVVTFEHRAWFADLEWVHSVQAGVDRFPMDTFEREGVILTNSTGIHDRTVGETVAGYLLAFSRRFHRHVANQQRREWIQPDWDEAFTLPGTTACVVGTGTLGRGVAEVAGSLGVSMRGVRRTPEDVPGFDDIYTSDDLLEAVSGVDFVVSTLPLTDETRGLFDVAVFEAMDEGAYVINVGRGPVVDEAALIEALEAGEVAGAALDVFETEPLPSDSPLWAMNDVIVTPHSAAFTVDYYRDIAGLVQENVRRLEVGEAFTNRVV
ncbi:D-2-hydroxyacid dehydrogenase [Natronosalvus halobius]|uniref:D-2-hydroxyacid dehydrogenase n=1 Tax=Natronosalvus halobius TaxID=2953746 RepID=UPI00209C8D15|nr:D-2-hydroxyacid dehydrogenase [Natronosalvus halobius]USZ70497.1 D-2-hydroxyacid dehydrogenase [Natronosalvus halobius]